MATQNSIKIVLGSYDATPHPFHQRWVDDTWIISDLNPRFPNMEQIDARAIPYTEVDALYASHLLEHIHYSEVEETLKHWYNVLKPGGTLVINVPDIEYGLDVLMKVNCNEPTGSEYFDCRDKVMQIFNGTQESFFDTHKSWFTLPKLKKLLKQAGFSKIKIWTEHEAHDMQCIIAEVVK